MTKEYIHTIFRRFNCLCKPFYVMFCSQVYHSEAKCDKVEGIKGNLEMTGRGEEATRTPRPHPQQETTTTTTTSCLGPQVAGAQLGTGTAWGGVLIPTPAPCSPWGVSEPWGHLHPSLHTTPGEGRIRGGKQGTEWIRVCGKR